MHIRKDASSAGGNLAAVRLLDTLQNPLFCGKVGQLTVFLISTRHCVDVCKFSAMKRVEDERLILPGMQLHVKAVLDYGNDLFHIQLEEVAGTLPLLDYLHPDLVTSPHRHPSANTSRLWDLVLKDVAKVCIIMCCSAYPPISLTPTFDLTITQTLTMTEL